MPRIKDELRLEDLAIDVRSDPPTAPVLASLRSSQASPKQRNGALLAAIGGIAFLSITALGFALFWATDRPRAGPGAKSDGATADQGGPVPPSSESDGERTGLQTDEAGRGRDDELQKNDALTAKTDRKIETKPSEPARAPEPYVETARFGAGDTFVEQVRLLPDGKTLLTAGQDKLARLWDLRTGREVRRLWHPDGIRAAVVLPDGKQAVTGCSDGFVRLWDLETGKLVRNLVKHSGPAITVAASPDGRFIVSGGEEPFLRVSKVETGGEERQIEGQSAALWSLAIAADGKRVLTGGYDGIIRFGDLKSSTWLVPLEQQSGWVFGVAFAPDNEHAVSSCIGQLILWDLGAKRLVRQKNLDNRQLAAITLADRHRLVFCSHFKREDNGVSNDGRIGTWDFESDDPPQIIHRGPPGHLSLALLPEGGIVTGDVDGFARIWEPSGSIERARVLVKAGYLANAVTEYGKAIAQRPGDVRLLIERGRLFAELG